MTASLLKIRKAADEEWTRPWGLFAWFVWPIAIPAVYLRSPKMPDSMLESLSEEGVGTSDLALLERTYVKRYKARQVKEAWTGTALSWATGILFYLSRTFG